MAIKVKEGRVRSNGVIYKIGETITDLSNKDEVRLISLKVAEYVENIVGSNKSIDPEDTGYEEKEKNAEENPEGNKEEIEALGESCEPNDEGNAGEIKIDFNPDDVIAKPSTKKGK